MFDSKITSRIVKMIMMKYGPYVAQSGALFLLGVLYVQASLMSALAQVSSRALASAQAQGGAFMSGAAASAGGQGASAGLSSSTAAGQVKLPALNRMVEVLLYNLPHIQVRDVSV